MFESLKHWFESPADENKLFNHPDDDAIHMALASLLYHVMSTDKRVTDREKHEFGKILREEFDLKDKQVARLFDQVKSLQSDIHDDLETIKHYLKENQRVRMRFMDKLNHLITMDGVKSEELRIFYDAQKALFPEISERSDF